MGKSFLFFGLLLLVLSGCAFSQETPMDQLSKDGNYHYKNKDLEFSLVLPPEFIYYQTQRKEAGNDFIDIEFFIPTADTAYHQEVQSYAKPIVIRVFSKDFWQNQERGKALYQKLAETRNKIYTIRFWDEPPADWANKWSEEMQKKIIENFVVK